MTTEAGAAPEPRYDSAGLCSAPFDTETGTGICETFGPHDRHAGVVVIGQFLCHSCRRAIGQCRCRR
jgi:hypothetical protein